MDLATVWDVVMYCVGKAGTLVLEVSVQTVLASIMFSSFTYGSGQRAPRGRKDKEKCLQIALGFERPAIF